MKLIVLFGVGCLIAVGATVWWVRWFRRWREDEDISNLTNLVRKSELLRSLYRATPQSQRLPNTGLFGDGSDGVLVVAANAVVSLNREMHLTKVQWVDTEYPGTGSVDLNGYRLFCRYGGEHLHATTGERREVGFTVGDRGRIRSVAVDNSLKED